MNLYQKMLAITAELQTVAKNLTVSTGSSSYKAVSERDVIDAVKPLEVKHGVYSFPVERSIVESDRYEKTSMYKGEARATTQFFIKLKTVYRFINAEKPEEYIDITSFSTGLDAGDKAEGKAMTYGDKYALMKAYKISTGDDPDQQASEDAHYTELPITETNIDALMMKANEKQVDINVILKTYKVADLHELTQSQWVNAMRRLDATK